MAKDVLKKTSKKKKKRRSSSAETEHSATPDEAQTEEALTHQLGIKGRQLKLKSIQRYDEMAPESWIAAVCGLQTQCTLPRFFDRKFSGSFALGTGPCFL